MILAKEKHLVTTESQLGSEVHCVEFQNSDSNINTKAVCQDIHGMGFQGQAAIVGVMYSWQSTID